MLTSLSPSSSWRRLLQSWDLSGKGHNILDRPQGLLFPNSHSSRLAALPQDCKEWKDFVLVCLTYDRYMPSNKPHLSCPALKNCFRDSPSLSGRSAL